MDQMIGERSLAYCFVQGKPYVYFLSSLCFLPSNRHYGCTLMEDSEQIDLEYKHVAGGAHAYSPDSFCTTVLGRDHATEQSLFYGRDLQSSLQKKKKKEIEVQGDFRGKVNEKELLCSA